MLRWKNKENEIVFNWGIYVVALLKLCSTHSTKDESCHGLLIMCD